MKLNKSAYLFAAALVASTMGMTSCSSEDEIGVETVAGQNTDVTIGLSVKGAGVNTKATADEMNFDGTADIKNIAVVPYVGELTPQKPICWTSITPVDGAASTGGKTVQMVNSVDRFRVYGNLSEKQYAKVSTGVYGLTDADFALTTASTIGTLQCYNPHTQLYYYTLATEYYKATSGTDWTTAPYGDALSSGSIDDAKYIKISNVNYAVGVLAAAVMNGDPTQCFYTNKEANQGAMDAATAGVTVSAVLVGGQRDFTTNLTTTGDAKTIYVAAENGGKFSENKITDTGDAGEKGNVFSVVSPTANGESVNVNIEFTLPANVYLKTTSGNVIGGTSATKFYLGLKLTKDATHTNEVFAADFVTILNATVKNWGIASEDPVTVTDAQIGVEFDVEWQKGNLYDVEI